MKTSSITLDNIKDEGWANVYFDLGFSHEEGTNIFEYGEYGSITIEIDENLNIIGGQINRFKI